MNDDGFFFFLTRYHKMGNSESQIISEAYEREEFAINCKMMFYCTIFHIVLEIKHLDIH